MSLVGEHRPASAVRRRERSSTEESDKFRLTDGRGLCVSVDEVVREIVRHQVVVVGPERGTNAGPC